MSWTKLLACPAPKFLARDQGNEPEKRSTDFMRRFYAHSLPRTDDGHWWSPARASVPSPKEAHAGVVPMAGFPDPSTFNAVETVEDLALNAYVQPAFQYIMEMDNVEEGKLENAGSTDGTHRRTTLRYLAKTLSFALTMLAVALARDRAASLIEKLPDEHHGGSGSMPVSYPNWMDIGSHTNRKSPLERVAWLFW